MLWLCFELSVGFIPVCSLLDLYCLVVDLWVLLSCDLLLFYDSLDCF